MIKTTVALSFAAAFALSTAAFAADNANPNGAATPTKSSSTAATPASEKHSPGTVGAMKHAGQGSFTASKKAQKNVKLK